MKVVLGILILAFSNVDVQFDLRELTLRSYIITKALTITSQVELIDKSEFTKITLDEKSETFMVNVVVLEAKVLIRLSKTA